MRRGLSSRPGSAALSMTRRRSLALFASASTLAAVVVSAPLASTVHASTNPATFLKTLAGAPANPAAMYPSGLAWDAHDNRLVVADTGNDQIDVFSPTGTKLLTFGTYGTANGQFDTPREVAVDGSSNIYVADAANNRIQAFSSAGTFLWTSGGVGACNSCLNTPIGITYDAVDNVLLVADTGHSLIKAFSPSDGSWIWTSPRSFLSSPREATLGPDGGIWVADYHAQEVQAFTVTGIGTSTPGWNTTPYITLGDGLAGGHALGELNFPYDVSFSPDGKTAYVADTGNERIAIWNIGVSPPAPVNPIGSRCAIPCPSTYPGVTPPLEFQDLRRVVVDPSGNLWAADFWGSGIHEFSPSGAAETEIDGFTSSAPGFEEAYGVAVAANGTVYAMDRLDQRMEEFDSSGNYVTRVGQRGTQTGSYSWPEDVAVDPVDNTVWVADTRNNRLQQYPADLSGTPTVIGSTTQGSAVGQWNYIEGITVSAAGIVYTADTANDRIQSYNPSTQAFAVFGSLGAGSGQLDNPEAIAVSATDMYVADTLNNRIEEFDLSGNYVNQYSTGLNQPQGIALAPDGTLWVADTMNNEIVHLSSTLTNLGDTFGSLGSGNMQFFQPHSLAVYANGGNPILFVADTYNNRIQEFSLGGGSGVGPAAKLAFTQQPASSSPGAAFPTQPTVAVEDTNGNVVTTDTSAVHVAITSGTGTSGAALSCTTNPLNASSGVAAFGNCAINAAGTGYTLTATDGSLTSAISSSFNITASSGGPPTWAENISNPNGVAPLYPAAGVADPSGNRFVADSGGSRIVEINSSGVQTTVSTAVSDPRAIAWDSAGPDTDLWVASTSSNSIVEMTTTGTTVATLTGSELNQPYGVADDSTGVYVANTYALDVVKLNKTTGAVIWTQTTCGGVAFGRSRGLTIGSDGNLYVADTDNDRIVPLNATTGACGTPFGSTGTGSGQFKSPWTLLSDGAGGLWVADAMNFRIEHVSNTGTYISQIGSFGNGPGNAQFRSPHGLFMDGGLLDVADPYTFSIQRFTISAGALTYSSFLGGTQPAAGGFNGAFAATYDSSGDIYAVDWFNDRIQEFSPSGAFVRQWGGYGSKPGSFIFPRGITMQPAGTTNAGDVVVTNSEDNRIDLYTPTGTFVESIKPSSGTAFSRPYQTVAAPDGTYWVADALNNRIVNINASGAVLSTFNDGGLMNQPQGIAMDAEGNLYVSDAGNNAVEKYNQSGTLLATLATSGSGPTNVSTPYALTVTGAPGSEHLLIADAGNNRILAITTGGAAMWSFGTAGSGNSQLSSPRGAAVDPVTGNIVVSDFLNNRLSIWGQTSSPPPAPGPYHVVAPFRICDTRAPASGITPNQCDSGSGTIGALGPNATRTVQVGGISGSNVPATGVSAVVVNVTAIAPSTGTYLTLFPAGGTRPNGTSNLNPATGSVVANLVEVAVSSGGAINVFNNAGTVNIAIDVEGYVSTTTSGTTGLYNPVAPTRICDTRAASGIASNQCDLGGQHPIVAGSPLTFNVHGSGSPIPASGVSAVVFNLTAIAPTANTALTAYAGGASEPHASNLNLLKNATVPNRVIVPVPAGCSSTCTVTIANSVGSVNVAIDVDGWFTDSSGIQTTGALFSGLAPTRVCDTRTSGSLAPGCTEGSVNTGGHISINLSGVAGIPSISGSNPPVAVVINVTAVEASTGTYVTVYPGGGSSTPPGVSDLNVPAGVTETNLVVVKVGPDGSIDLYNNLGSVNLIVDVMGYYS
jgi:DNA-binding beta-propeller fold protein YncE